MDYSEIINGLPEDVKNSKVIQNTKSVEDLATQLVNLNKLVGKQRVELPDQSAPKESWDSFYNAVGRPNSPDGYTFKSKDQFKENVPYIEEVHNMMRNKAHELGLTKKQGEEYHNAYVQTLEDLYSKKAQASSTQITEWDNKFKEEHKDKIDVVTDLETRTLDWAGSEVKEALEKANIIKNPAIRNLLVKVGETMADELAPGGSGGSSTIPSAEAAKHELNTLFADEKFMEMYTNQTNPGYKDAQTRVLKLHEAIHGTEIVASLPVRFND